MSPNIDYVTWSTLLQVGGVIVTMNAIPFAWVWGRVDKSCSRQELNDAMKARDESDIRFRADIKELFKAAEKDREDNNKKFFEMQRSINDVHLSILSKLRE